MPKKVKIKIKVPRWRGQRNIMYFNKFCLYSVFKALDGYCTKTSKALLNTSHKFLCFFCKVSDMNTLVDS